MKAIKVKISFIRAKRKFIVKNPKKILFWKMMSDNFHYVEYKEVFL